ncbi:MAG: UDP-N-acetylmuramoyl-tripeptide--D-alanyl-D-alanine ligase, partial [Desulfovibrio sp.]|nr:UDP-N-acetylmuramoyl-tripeptide--D-alanyl-D-alanine ligase [Desulfovibrio sp.]
MRLSLHAMAAHLGLARPESRDQIHVSSVVTDSRKAVPGSLFVCIAGERTDGHEYAASAVAQGASMVLASRPLADLEVPVLQVEDTVRALGSLAGLWRSMSNARVIGVTGTAGKTTLKEALAQVLAVRGKTARNAMNLNNQIGMPLSVLGTDGDEDFWVMEAGISHDGDMDDLASVLRPDLGLILNVGPGHTEGLGGRGVAWHKARMLAWLAEGGSGLVSADYPDLCREVSVQGAPVRYFSTRDRGSEFYAAWLGQEGTLGHYTLQLPGCALEVAAPFGGAYGAENCIAIAAAAHLMGLEADEIAEGLRTVQLPSQRFRYARMGSWDVIDDTYNANPLSMSRMLEAAAGQAQGRAFVVVLGEMGELGACSGEMHEDLGWHLAHLAPQAVFWAGGQALAVHTGLKAGGYGGAWLPVEGVQDFVAAWKDHMISMSNGLILFKGSRFNGLEKYVQALRVLLGQDSKGM